MECPTCGTPISRRTRGSGRQKLYCSKACWPSADYVTTHPPGACTTCGKRMMYVQSDEPRCKECRRTRKAYKPTVHLKQCKTCRRMFETTRGRQLYCDPRCSAHGRSSGRTWTCIDCGSPCYSTRCRSCYDQHVKAEADPEAARQRKRERAMRRRRERVAPGLTVQQVRNLGIQWRRQLRRCTYCDALATQVDHVIPLALGGTNHEGNLTPCCASCNARKSDSLLVEWRHKVRVARQRTEPPPLAQPQRVRRIRWGTQAVLFPLAQVARPKPKTPRSCAKCGAVFYSHHAAYCSRRCRPSTMSGAQQRRRQRERATTPGGPIAA